MACAQEERGKERGWIGEIWVCGGEKKRLEREGEIWTCGEHARKKKERERRQKKGG